MKIENPKLNLEVIKRFLHIPARSPDRIQIEVTNKCNLDCKMCPKNNFNLPIENMDIDFFKKIVDKLENVNLILPVGWGESFVHPKLNEIVDYLKLNKHEVKVTTNGLLLNNEKNMDTALKMDYLTFSLDEIEGSDTGHQSTKIIENIKKIISIRLEKGLKKPFLALQSVLYKENKDVHKVIELAADLKVDRVNIIRPYTKFNKELSMCWKERKDIYKKAEKLGRKLGIRVDIFEYATFNGIKRTLWKYFKWIFRINSWCPRLYDFCYVTMDGKVTPCCDLPHHIIGDLKEQTIEDIWKSEKMKSFRKNHKNICHDCHVLKVK